MNLDLLLQPDLMREEVLERGREHLAGLEEGQIMTLWTLRNLNMSFNEKSWCITGCLMTGLYAQL